MEAIFEAIKKSFNNKIKVETKRPNIFQLYLPLYHEDGDMIDIYLEKSRDNSFVIADHGKTLQRLSYEFDIDTPNKETILEKILLENGLNERNGNIFMPTTSQTIFTDLLHVTNAYSKIGSMKYFKREMLESLFIEMLEEYIFSELVDFNPKSKVVPMPASPEYEVDYSFSPNGHPVYLMGIKHPSQAKLATINFMAFKLAKLNFRGWVVYESFESLGKSDISRLSNASEKQFTSFNNFKEDIRYYLEKERN
ncbi:MAG: DUF1828 domain-containing protein [Sphingobacteriales bacterium]|nr:DUF1828 domain-containing protein [Sphingobacteriales bacterium]